MEYLATTATVETLPNGRKHFIIEETDEGYGDNTDVYTVPAGHYFGMGVNRDRSKDSRYLEDVGYIPRENLVGREVLDDEVIRPLDRPVGNGGALAVLRGNLCPDGAVMKPSGVRGFIAWLQGQIGESWWSDPQ